MVISIHEGVVLVQPRAECAYALDKLRAVCYNGCNTNDKNRKGSTMTTSTLTRADVLIPRDDGPTIFTDEEWRAFDHGEHPPIDLEARMANISFGLSFVALGETVEQA